MDRSKFESFEISNGALHGDLYWRYVYISIEGLISGT